MSALLANEKDMLHIQALFSDDSEEAFTLKKENCHILPRWVVQLWIETSEQQWLALLFTQFLAVVVDSSKVP